MATRFKSIRLDDEMLRLITQRMIDENCDESTARRVRLGRHAACWGQPPGTSRRTNDGLISIVTTPPPSTKPVQRGGCAPIGLMSIDPTAHILVGSPVPAQTAALDLHPPLHLRCVVFHGNIDPTTLENKSSAWLKNISNTFPHAQQRKEWKLEIVGKDEMIKPRVKLDLIPVQERRDGMGRTTADITSYPDKIMLRLQRQGKYLGSFLEMQKLAEEFVPTWLDTFAVTRIKGIELIYVNLLCKEYTPAVITDIDGIHKIEIGRALQMFSNIPGMYNDLRSPYSAQITAQIKEGTNFSFQVNDLPSGSAIGGPAGAAIQVTFGYQSMFPNKPLDLLGALDEVTTGHNVLLEQFTHFFTASARQSFK